MLHVRSWNDDSKILLLVIKQSLSFFSPFTQFFYEQMLPIAEKWLWVTFLASVKLTSKDSVKIPLNSSFRNFASKFEGLDIWNISHKSSLQSRTLFPIVII